MKNLKIELKTKQKTYRQCSQCGKSIFSGTAAFFDSTTKWSYCDMTCLEKSGMIFRSEHVTIKSKTEKNTWFEERIKEFLRENPMCLRQFAEQQIHKEII